MRLSTKTVILDLLSASPNSAISVEALIRGAAVLQHSEGSVRVCLSRLLSGELVTSENRGGYRLGAAAFPVQSLVREWRNCGRESPSWAKKWLALHGGAPKTRKLQQRHAQAKDFLGFKTLRPGLSIRPANLEFSLSVLREKLFSLGLAEDTLLFELGELDEQAEIEARSLWNVDEVNAAYQKQQQHLLEVTARLEALSLEDAARETFFSGRDCIRLLTLDPALPEDIMDSAPRRELVEEMKRFDLLGRQFWQQILEVNLKQVPVWAGVSL